MIDRAGPAVVTVTGAVVALATTTALYGSSAWLTVLWCVWAVGVVVLVVQAVRS